MAVRGESSVRGAVDPVEPDLARSIRSWMRAYPRRWRAVRGEEMFGLVADLARPGARRLSARASIDLLRGGWATRWREHPPVHTWLLYRVFDKRIPVRFRAWALDDINGYWFPLRRFAFESWWVPLYALLPGFPATYFWAAAYLVLCVVSMLVGSARRRRTAVLKHVAARPGELVFEGALVIQDGPRRRATARSALTCAAVSFGAMATTSVVSAAFAPQGLHSVPVPGLSASFDIVDGPIGSGRIVAITALVVALGLGVVFAARARRRLRRLLGQRRDQSLRFLRPVSGAGKVALTLGMTAFTALAWLESTGRTPLGTSTIGGVVALLLLPGALVGLIEARSSGATDLAGSDVWCIAANGRVPDPDTPVPDLHVLAGQYPEGVVVKPRPLGDPSYPALP
jgi:hypothetical protein